MIELVLLVGGILVYASLNKRIVTLQREVAELHAMLAGRRPAQDEPARLRPATVERDPPTAPVSPWEHSPVAPREPVEPAEPIERAEPRETARIALPEFSLEKLIGGQLPIWIGGAALVLAGFFLVRLTIESGLLGPVARTILAALFAVALIVLSELARNLRWTRDDHRVAQALAGAGVASGYATLYIAAALYHLIAPLPAFVLMLLVTAGALGLALRHGPPTAIMALIGGFVAPLVAGFDAAGVGPLLVYLALFTAALFALAVQRGWGWLALAAALAGFGWINFLIYALARQDLAGVGAFAVLLAVGCSAALPATGLRSIGLRLAPLLAGLLQLLVLAPSLDFDGLAWSFYLVLAAATLFLAWRDARYLPGTIAALALTLLLEATALLQPERSATPIAIAIATLIFAVPGHILLRRSTSWAALAIAGTAAPLLVAQICAPGLMPLWGWILLELAAAALVLWAGWRLRNAAHDIALVAATCVAGLMAATGLGQAVPFTWLALPLTIVMLSLGGWARLLDRKRLYALPTAAFVAALLAASPVLWRNLHAIVESLTGTPYVYALLPTTGAMLRALPAISVGAFLLLADPRQFARARAPIASAALAIGLLALYTLAKQPLAISHEQSFVAWGFAERALITQALMASGWLLLRHGRLAPFGWGLLATGFFRLVWFDWLICNPAFTPQWIGGLPLLNLATLHFALAAFWLWTLPRTAMAGHGERIAAAIATIATLMATVRQAAHGAIFTGPVTTFENGGYSAVLLLLALFWLWRGIHSGARDLRIFGLGLLTIVTFKVFLVDASALDGVLRILSFLGLGLALIGIGWAYNRFLGGRSDAEEATSELQSSP
ncbi:DUF2339 domain-containing protein [Sphingosinithalassobacter portus]|uniref:DUF2339 domain-containing protein n=1 Tax=Stakelama portus TaxID=2676234 RepID=UPI000D6E137D|nr:DUF2339 domain-containing protein [Sphingosinithalassobacter portus]